MPRDRVVVVGAGVAGLVAAFALAARGLDVTLLERGAAPGGKMRQIAIGDARIDSGPTVFTMRWVFDELFAAAGKHFADHVRLRPLEILARHAWDENARLDLFADQDRAVDAIGDFAGAAEAARDQSFCRDTRRIYDLLEKSFLRAPQPSISGLIGTGGFRGLTQLHQIKPFASMWSALSRYFHDPRLRQLFGRYATYCGSSPFKAPATLMLVAHVEREGVWSIDGGMQGLARALADSAKALGAGIRYDQDVAEVLIQKGRAGGVRLSNGEHIEADAVI
ncbi:phytoene desaturase family protein, partial [Bradyrhizobium sp.]|uniref:phytoene desaturase family protein n=1 Tax=Bradyrhizobium sp. TaxID=376 RepID=UPI003C460A00